MSQSKSTLHVTLDVTRATLHPARHDRELPRQRHEALYRDGTSRQFSTIAKVALRKLDMIDAAMELRDLRLPPGNRLGALKDDRAGQHSIRINDQWRICFIWRDGSARRVEIVDYH